MKLLGIIPVCVVLFITFSHGVHAGSYGRSSIHHKSDRSLSDVRYEDVGRSNFYREYDRPVKYGSSLSDPFIGLPYGYRYSRSNIYHEYDRPLSDARYGSRLSDSFIGLPYGNRYLTPFRDPAISGRQIFTLARIGRNPWF